MNRFPSDVHIKYIPTNIQIMHPIVYKAIMMAHSLLSEITIYRNQIFGSPGLYICEWCYLSPSHSVTYIDKLPSFHCYLLQVWSRPRIPTPVRVPMALIMARDMTDLVPQDYSSELRQLLRQGWHLPHPLSNLATGRWLYRLLNRTKASRHPVRNKIHPLSLMLSFLPRL